MTRSALGAIVGLLLGVLIGLDLVLLGVLSTGTPLVFALAVVGLVLGAWSGQRAARRQRTAEIRDADHSTMR